MKLARVLFFLSLILAVAPQARSQANVVENQTTVVYVDAQSGSDSNAGTVSSPLKTIQAAVNKANINNQKSIGTKIIVAAGVYRETVNVVPVTGMTSAPLTIQAATNGTAIISASDILTGWSADPQYSGAYVTNWTSAQGTCALPSGWPAVQEIALHTEMLFVNGIPMTQVINDSDLKPGTFFVSTSDGTLHLWPPSGTDPSTATIEAASRAKTISVISRSNVVLRGLAFEHAASCIDTSGATVTSSSNVLIDSVQANWNSWGGLAVSGSSNITVQNSMASYNGGVGFQGTKDQAALYTGNETDYNNWRGAQATFYNWASAGAKFFQMRTTSVQGHSSYNNQAQGLWFDTDNQNITINNATLVGSYDAALQLERSEGPITLENSHLCSSGAGVNVLTTQGLTVNNSVFYNNGTTNKYEAQFYLAGTAGGVSITNWQTGQVYDLVTTGTTMSGNAFIDGLPGQYVFGTYLSGTDWSDFTSTLKSNDNTWYDPNTANAFQIVNGKNVDLAGWQAATGGDYNSAWSAPSVSPVSACAAPASPYPDFNVSVDSGAYTMTSGLATAILRVNSFNFGAVNLSVSGLPSGVTASFSNASLTSGSSTLTLTASSTSTAQTVPVTLWGISGDRVHSATFNLAITPNPAAMATSTSLSSSASTIGKGATITLSATVKPASGAGTPAGSVTFYDGTTSLGSATLSSGTATLATSALQAGTNSLTAVYAGSGNFLASTSSTIVVTANTAAGVSTSTTLASSASSVAQDAPVTLTATVKPSSGSTLPSGTVTFYSGTLALGSATLSSGVASISTSALPVGTDTVSAAYSGAIGFNASSSNIVPITVNGAASTAVSTVTTLTSSATSIAQNSPLTLVAAVKASSGTSQPTGTVTFFDGSQPIGTASLASGAASITTTTLAPGHHTLTASYSGTASLSQSTSSILDVIINAASAPTAVATSTALASSITQADQGSTISLTATVAAASGSSSPTGNVDFMIGKSNIGTAALANGKAYLTTAALPPGDNAITASYEGDSSFAASSSSAITVNILGPDFTVSATPSSITATPGQSVNVALLITPKNGFDQIPALACSGLPSGSTCSFGAPAKQSDGASTVQMTIHTAPLAAQSGPTVRSRAPLTLALFPLLFWISSKRRREFSRLLSLATLFISVVILGAGAIGCGGITFRGAGQAAGDTVNVTVSAQTASGINHTTTVSLTLK